MKIAIPGTMSLEQLAELSRVLVKFSCTDKRKVKVPYKAAWFIISVDFVCPSARRYLSKALTSEVHFCPSLYIQAIRVKFV